MVLNGVTDMNIELEKSIAAKLVTSMAFDYMDKESMFDGVPIGIGAWEFEYVEPSIFQSKSYDILAKFKYNKQNTSNTVKDLGTIVLSMDKVFKIFQFEDLNKFDFMKLYFEYFSIVSRKNKLGSVPNLIVKAKFEGDQIDEFFFNIPSFEFDNDNVLVINTHEFAYKNGVYYAESAEGLHKISKNLFCKHILICYLNSIVSNINRILNISIDIVDTNERDVVKMIEKYKDVVDMMYN